MKNYTSVDPKQFTVSKFRLKPVILISECFCSRCGHTNQHPHPTWRETTGDNGRQDHFRAQEGGHTNQHPPPTWRETTGDNGRQDHSEPKKPTTPTSTKAARSKVALRTPTVNCLGNNDNHTDHMAMIISMVQRYNVNIKTRNLHYFYDNDHDAMWNCPQWHDMISSLMMMMMMMLMMMKDDIFVVADDDDNLGHGYDGDADTDACSTLMASKHEPGIDKKTWFYTCQKLEKNDYIPSVTFCPTVCQSPMEIE